MSSTATASSRDPLLGQTVGNYTITSKLGAGGMGCVYLARHVFLKRCVAIKVLQRDVSEQEDLWKRFCREAEALDVLQSDHIVRIHDFGRLASGQPYLVMQYVEGSTLREVLTASAPLDVGYVLALAEQLAQALAVSHEAGVVHRDLKPENIVLVPLKDGCPRVVLLDYGIATRPDSLTANFETRAGVAIGTPYYMAPEQIRDSHNVDARADVYAFGVLLYEMFTGRWPFEGRNREEVLAKVLFESAAPIESVRRDLPEGLGAIVRRAMARELGARFPSIQELRLALSACGAAALDRCDSPSSVPLPLDASAAACGISTVRVAPPEVTPGAPLDAARAASPGSTAGLMTEGAAGLRPHSRTSYLSLLLHSVRAGSARAGWAFVGGALAVATLIGGTLLLRARSGKEQVEASPAAATVVRAGPARPALSSGPSSGDVGDLRPGLGLQAVGAEASAPPAPAMPPTTTASDLPAVPSVQPSAAAGPAASRMAPLDTSESVALTLRPRSTRANETVSLRAPATTRPVPSTTTTPPGAPAPLAPTASKVPSWRRKFPE